MWGTVWLLGIQVLVRIQLRSGLITIYDVCLEPGVYVMISPPEVHLVTVWVTC